MTLTLHLGPGLYTAVAVVVGLALLLTAPSDSWCPSLRGLAGLLLILSVPFVWLGWWLKP